MGSLVNTSVIKVVAKHLAEVSQTGYRVPIHADTHIPTRHGPGQPVWVTQLVRGGENQFSGPPTQSLHFLVLCKILDCGMTTKGRISGGL